MEGLGLPILYILSSARKSDRSRRTPACGASKRQSFPTGTRDAIRRGPIGQQPYNHGLTGACSDFSLLRKLRQRQEFPVPSWSVVAPYYNVQPTLPEFVACAARSKG